MQANFPYDRSLYKKCIKDVHSNKISLKILKEVLQNLLTLRFYFSQFVASNTRSFL